MVAVGATFVGSIAMTTCRRPAREKRMAGLDMPVNQMAEMGHFAMGSTIILVFPAGRVEKVLVQKGETVRVGQPLFRLKNCTSQNQGKGRVLVIVLVLAGSARDYIKENCNSVTR